jgi:hypothetical protein
MPPVGFEPIISAGERPENYGLDRAATGTGNYDALVTAICPPFDVLNRTQCVGNWA